MTSVSEGSGEKGRRANVADITFETILGRTKIDATEITNTIPLSNRENPLT